MCKPRKPLVAGVVQSTTVRHRSASSRDGKAKYPETKDWKTFRSKDYGFQLSYPPGGQLQTASTMNQVRVRIDLPVPGGTLLKEKRCYVLDGVLGSINPGVYTSPPLDDARGESAVFSRIAYTIEFI